MVHAVIMSKLDYCNAVLMNLPEYVIQRLQFVMNEAARLITQTPRSEHVTPTLFSLHWLPVRWRIQYKIILLTFKALHGLAPEYIVNLLSPYVPSRGLRSSTQSLLCEPRYNLERYGARAFQNSAPRLWNCLPLRLREESNLNVFKKDLKTFLFRKAYPSLT